ncbi:hypothetical protein KR074_000753, partial [Drosophila pseudoananassae]
INIYVFQVITNKKVIQKARAQTIAKLIQKLRKAKEALAKHPDGEKEKTRLRKNTECLAQLKALKCLDIVRQSLLQEGTNPNTVIASERSTPDELGIAMLRLNKLMHGLVDKFMEVLELKNDKDAKWREEILESSKRRVKQERTEEKKRKRKELKEQKAQTKNRLEWLEQNKVQNGANLEVEVPVASEVKPEPALTTEIETETSKVIPKKEPKETKPRKEKIERKQLKEKKERKLIKEKKERNPAEKPQRKVKPTDSKPTDRDHNAEKRPRDHNAEKRPRRETNRSEEEEPKPQKDRPTHVEDPFFITESGQPYMSTAVVLDENNETEAEEKPAFRDNFRSEDNRTRYQKRYSESHTEFRPKKTDDRHPSWLAKQQNKPVIGDFRGKKIKFSENGETAETSAPAPIQGAPTPASTEGMHPSWVAKQKWKPKIAAFQGTKIKFDE